MLRHQFSILWTMRPQLFDKWKPFPCSGITLTGENYRSKGKPFECYIVILNGKPFHCWDTPSLSLGLAWRLWCKKKDDFLYSTPVVLVFAVPISRGRVWGGIKCGHLRIIHFHTAFLSCFDWFVTGTKQQSTGTRSVLSLQPIEEEIARMKANITSLQTRMVRGIFF